MGLISRVSSRTYRFLDESKKIIIVPKPPILLSQTDMKNIGLNLSTGWINYLRHKPEPRIILVRRHLTCKVKLNKSINPKNYPTLEQIYNEGDGMYEQEEQEERK